MQSTHQLSVGIEGKFRKTGEVCHYFIVVIFFGHIVGDQCSFRWIAGNCTVCDDCIVTEYGCLQKRLFLLRRNGKLLYCHFILG